jgi:creatinine amidohydrolase
MRYGDCTWPEIARHAAAGAVAIVPFGCTEQQGPHLPVDFDTWFAEEICLAAADRLTTRGAPTLVLPAVPFGPTPEHRNFGGGFVDLPAAVHDAVAHAALTSLARQGFRTIVAWRGCGGHDLRAAVDEVNTAGPAQVLLPAPPLGEFWTDIGGPPVQSGHADSFTTSISMYRRPDSVRVDLVPPESSAKPDWDDPELDFARYSTSGIIGDATAATAERGRLLWQRCLDWTVEYVSTTQTAASSQTVPHDPG